MPQLPNVLKLLKCLSSYFRYNSVEYDKYFLKFRCRGPLFGASHSYSMPNAHDQILSKARVAADYSDSVPDSPKYAENRGYHPLEELKDRAKDRDRLLSDAEIARTTVEVILILKAAITDHMHYTYSIFGI